MTRTSSIAPSATVKPTARTNPDKRQKYAATPPAMASREKIRSSPPPKRIANQKAAVAQTAQNRASSAAVTALSGSRPRTIRIQS